MEWDGINTTTREKDRGPRILPARSIAGGGCGVQRVLAELKLRLRLNNCGGIVPKNAVVSTGLHIFSSRILTRDSQRPERELRRF
jgi:hypothetical protein